MPAVFLTRERVKTTLSIPAGTTHYDARIDNLLVPAERALLSFLGQPGLTRSTYAETHDVGAGQDYIATRAWPIVSVAALTNDGALVAAADYAVDGRYGYVRLKGAVSTFAEGKQKVAVTYTAGYAPVDDRFVEAAAVVAAAMFNRGRVAGVSSFGAGSTRYQYSAEQVPPDAAAMVGDDRSIVPRTGIVYTIT